MRKPILGTFLIFALATLAWASDPWKSKPYDQWDQSDVRKILSDSPWSKTIPEDANWRGLGAPSGLPGGSDAGGRGGGGGGEAGGGGGGRPGGGGGGQAGGGAGGGGMGSAGGVAQVPFSVRWVSSLTIREALVRGAELRGTMKEDQAKQQLAQPVATTYQVMVSAPQMNPFMSVDETTLKAKAALVMKKSKQRIAPSAVQIQRSPDGRQIQGVIFSFPKKSDSGEATIGPDEKDVQFLCQIPELDLRANFDLSKMDSSQGRDL